MWPIMEPNKGQAIPPGLGLARRARPTQPAVLPPAGQALLPHATRLASRRGDAGIGPEHLLYGVLHDARDPLGTELSRRGRKQPAVLGWTAGRPNPLRQVLEARGINLTGLAAELGGA
jgi:hypothetical protein